MTREDAVRLAAWIWERHKERDEDKSLSWFQEERKIEQTYFNLFLTLWFLMCTPFMAASAYAITLQSRDTALGITIPCAVIITILSVLFGLAIRSSVQAQSYRHFQLVLLTSVSRKYRPWGFDWRLKNDVDNSHRLTFACVASSVGVVILACWVFPVLACRIPASSVPGKSIEAAAGALSESNKANGPTVPSPPITQPNGSARLSSARLRE
jgi:hypothetical protein